jgi:hypothetical protein
MKKNGAEEYLTKKMRKNGLNVDNTPINKTSLPLLDQIHQLNECVCCIGLSLEL